MIRKELAITYFKQGYNCSQAIVLVFKGLLSDVEELCKISSPFGGGIARLRETCGAVSGMVLVIGSLFGYNTPETGIKKKELYEKTQEIVGIFEKSTVFLLVGSFVD